MIPPRGNARRGAAVDAQHRGLLILNTELRYRMAGDNIVNQTLIPTHPSPGPPATGFINQTLNSYASMELGNLDYSEQRLRINRLLDGTAS